MGDDAPSGSRAPRAPAAPARWMSVIDARELARAEAHVLQPVQSDERRRRVDRVHDVVERPGECVDVLAVDRRDEGAVQALDDLVRQEVALVLDLLDLVGLVPDRGDRARASPRAGRRRAAARRPAPGNRRRTSLRAESDETPIAPPKRSAGCNPDRRIVADPFTRPLRLAVRALDMTPMYHLSQRMARQQRSSRPHPRRRPGNRVCFRSPTSARSRRFRSAGSTASSTFRSATACTPTSGASSS